MVDVIPEHVIAAIRTSAEIGHFDGYDTPMNQAYMDACSWFHPHTGSSVIFTRDTGHHTSGWFKNPDYERCLHLSLSFREPLHPLKYDPTAIWHLNTIGTLITPPAPIDYDEHLGLVWVKALFGDNVRYSWRESPKSDIGRRHGVEHWRVFCDPAWKPILPRKEVYTKTFTELGWKSWSDLGMDGPPSHVNAD